MVYIENIRDIDVFHFNITTIDYNVYNRRFCNFISNVKRIPYSIKILLSFAIYFLFGHLILLFKPFYKLINEYINNKNKFYNYLFKPGIKFLYLFIALFNFIPQIIFNFIILILDMIVCSFCFLIERIKNILFFELDFENYDMDVILSIFLFFINIEVYLYFYIYYAHKVSEIKRKIVLTSYFLIGFLNVFSYMQYYLFFGTINLIFHIINQKDIQKSFESVFERNLIKDIN